MSDGITIRFSGGHLLAVSDLARVVETTLGGALGEGVTALGVSLINVTPVRTGALQRDWQTSGKPAWDGARLTALVYNERVYAPFVQRRGRSAGYVDRGVAAGKDSAVAAIKAGGPALTAAMLDRLQTTADDTPADDCHCCC